MAENKTQPTTADVTAFLTGIDSAQRRDDAFRLIELMRAVTGRAPAMWGPSIIGFGHYRYTYDSGHSGEAPRVGFSPRKAALTLYLTSGYPMHDDLLARLGKHKKGKGCLYVTKLTDVDLGVLEQLIAASWAERNARYPE
jgi:hypothetical protein